MKRDEILARSSLDTRDTTTLARLQAQRRSCRAFSSQQIPADVLQRVFELAQLTASWCNAQPWQVIVTRGAGTEKFRTGLHEVASADAMKQISPEARMSADRRSDLPMPSEYTELRKERRRKAGGQLYEAMGVMSDRAASAKYTLENFRLFDAPHAVILTSAKELGTYGVLDVGGYLANLMLVLQSFAVSSIAQAALAVYGDYVHEFFKIPDDQVVICGMSIGYADEGHPSASFRTSRAPLSEIVTWYD